MSIFLTTTLTGKEMVYKHEMQQVPVNERSGLYYSYRGSSVEKQQLKHVDEITQIMCEGEEKKAKGFTSVFKGQVETELAKAMEEAEWGQWFDNRRTRKESLNSQVYLLLYNKPPPNFMV